MWTIDIAEIKNGKRKWRAKNRVSVALFRAKPPHTHSTRSFPARGIAERRLVITVAPQKDIWPQGNTYPRKAVPITIKSKRTPTVQVGVYKKEL